MGWKASFIAIKPADTSLTEENILDRLGYKNLKPLKSISGVTRTACWLATPKFPTRVFKRKAKLSDIEKNLVFPFPKAEIGIFQLHSVTNYWAYSVIPQGTKIRAKYGAADDGVLSDFGELLPEEKPFWDNFFLNEEGERLFRMKTSPTVKNRLGKNSFSPFRPDSLASRSIVPKTNFCKHK